MKYRNTQESTAQGFLAFASLNFEKPTWWSLCPNMYLISRTVNTYLEMRCCNFVAFLLFLLSFAILRKKV